MRKASSPGSRSVYIHSATSATSEQSTHHISTSYRQTPKIRLRYFKSTISQNTKKHVDLQRAIQLEHSCDPRSIHACIPAIFVSIRKRHGGIKLCRNKHHPANQPRSHQIQGRFQHLAEIGTSKRRTSECTRRFSFVCHSDGKSKLTCPLKTLQLIRTGGRKLCEAGYARNELPRCRVSGSPDCVHSTVHDGQERSCQLSALWCICLESGHSSVRPLESWEQTGGIGLMSQWNPSQCIIC
jgi:hypothetical protein